MIGRHEYTTLDPGPLKEDLSNLPEWIEKTKRESEKRHRVQVMALIAAGWTFELPAGNDPELMSWYWRRPPRRPGRKGRFFWSTNQAHNAMMREKA